MPEIPALIRHRLEDCEFKVSLDNLVRHYLRRKNVLKQWLTIADIWINMIAVVMEEKKSDPID